MMDLNYPVTDKFLGLQYRPGYSIFRVWAPTQDNIMLALYEDDSSIHRELYQMAKATDGVFELSLEGDLEGKFYTYIVGENEVTDPYAAAVSENGIRTAIIDIFKTNPPDWHEHNVIYEENLSDTIIYEVHLADYNGFHAKGKPGHYMSFIEEKEQGGIGHLRELGITHINFLPLNDFLTVDENNNATENIYNWGYDPEHYNVPEGSYASDNKNPMTRIIELKKMIQKLHEEGFKIILDVVYNHTYRGDRSNFNIIVPDYYYRKNSDGSFSDGSGVGNELATERFMVRRFILDSLCYWAKEFRIDGFRFDLMALIDMDTMREIVKELKEINPNIILYGEPWPGAQSVLPTEDMVTRGKQSELGIAIYNDSFRDAIKGANDDESKGFAQGNCSNKALVETGAAGSIDLDEYRIGFAKNPRETINYVNSHDNLILYDKIQKSVPYLDQKQKEQVNKLALGILFTSQGIPLIHAGNEILRSKQMDKNSYKSSADINEIRWGDKKKHREFYQYVRDLISLRKRYRSLRLGEAKEIREAINFIPAPGCILAYTLKESSNERILIIHNSMDRAYILYAENIFEEKIDIKSKQIFDYNGLIKDPVEVTNPVGFETPSRSTGVYSINLL